MPDPLPVLKRQKLFTERMESSPWLHGGRTYSGESAADIFRSAANDESQRSRPYCVYVHIPFCLSRCSYCALYTEEVRENRDEVFDAFLERFRASLEAHPQRDRLSPPVTVHFGGGTPLSLGTERFLRLRESVRAAFGDSPQCEWAVESTTSALDDRTIDALHEARFRRIHLGVQTLEDKVRRRIGRREPGKVVLAKIRRLIGMGFSVSADLILGFERFRPSMLDRDLRRLFEAGIRMFSICELRALVRKPLEAGIRLAESKANRELWRQVWDFMEEHGLRPIHAGQFGSSDRDNLFYTHPGRRESCVALGPYAHGSARNMIYGNQLLPGFLDAARSGRPVIDYAVVYPETVQRLRDLESDLLAHRVRRDTLDQAIGIWGEWLAALWEKWRIHGLAVPAGNSDFVLSRDGSWFVGNMIWQAREFSGLS